MSKIDPMEPGRIRSRFAENLIRSRQQLLLSQEEVGFRACLHRTEIGIVEQGFRVPRIDTLMKLAGALESSPYELLDGIAWLSTAPLVGSFVITARIESLRDAGSGQGRQCPS